ncbi:hypothetical protein ATANTOWER_021356, partial [Ataeniobius toweri]|nr:hypothetical protein [Ataeniobius toweri]
PRWCWSSQVRWGTGAAYSADCIEKYLSRRLPALRRQSVCLQWLTPDSWIYLAEHRFRSQKFCCPRLPTF